MDISVWWDTLTTLQKIHWGIALPSTIIFVIQLIITLAGGDADDIDADADSDFDGDGMHILSVKSVIITREGIINPSFFIAIVADYERMKIVDNGFSDEPSPFAELLSGKMKMLPDPCQSP